MISRSSCRILLSSKAVTLSARNSTVNGPCLRVLGSCRLARCPRVASGQFSSTALLAHAEIDERRKATIQRATSRGWPGLDALMGSFVVEHIDTFDDAKLALLGEILDMENPDLLKWVTGLAVVPDGMQNNEVMTMLLKHATKQREETCAPAPAEVVATLAPKGVLRAGINLSNFLLVSGQETSGEHTGVSPSLAAEFANRLGVKLRLVPYETPTAVCDAVGDDVWDIGLVGADPKRESLIAFSAPYVEIPSSYLVPPGSALKRAAEVDQKGIRISTLAGAAYTLWLEANIAHAELVCAPTMDAAFELLRDGKVHAVASIRQRLMDDAEKIAGSYIVDGDFMTVKQAVGVARNRGPVVEAFVNGCVEEVKACGFIAGLLERHSMVGKLLVAPLASALPCGVVSATGEAGS